MTGPLAGRRTQGSNDVLYRISGWERRKNREARQDKRTASRLGPCGWLGGLFSYGSRFGLPARFPEIIDISVIPRLARYRGTGFLAR